jgi:hypothetical protein
MPLDQAPLAIDHQKGIRWAKIVLKVLISGSHAKILCFLITTIGIASSLLQHLKPLYLILAA